MLTETPPGKNEVEKGPPPPPRPRARKAVTLCRPVMTLVFVALNLLMALAQAAAAGFRWNPAEIGSGPGDWALGAKVPSLVANGEYWRLVTANFLHGNWVHLAWNMVSLVALGLLIESFYGGLRFSVIYMLAAVGGAAVSYFGTPHISLGASTGIMGLMGALLLHNFRYRRCLVKRLNRMYPYLVAMAAVQFLFDMQAHGAVDVAGHAGGLVAGWVVAMLLESRMADECGRTSDRRRLPVLVAAAAGLFAYGVLGLAAALPRESNMLQAAQAPRPDAMADALERVIEERPYFAEGRIRLAEELIQLRRDDEAERQFREAMRDPRAAPYVRERFDDIAASYQERGDRAYNYGRWLAAASNYRRATLYARTGRTMAAASNQYAWTLVEHLKIDLDEAERYAQTSVRLEPKAESLDTLAWVYYWRSKPVLAEPVQKKAIELAEQNPQFDRGSLADYYYHMAAIYEKLGKRDSAIEYYARTLRIRATHVQAAEALRRLSGPGQGDSDDPTRQPEYDPAIQRGII